VRRRGSTPARAVALARRWAISVGSLVGGILTLFVFRRGLPHVGWIVGYLLLVWLLVGVMVQAREPLLRSTRRSRRLVVTAADYTIQTLYHGLLLFCLPAYWAATTLTSRNVVLLALLAALALIATFDPWYAALVRPRRWARATYFVVSTFATLNLALPLVGVPPFAALMLAAWAAVAALAPGAARATRWRWPRALAATALAGVAAALVVGHGRAWVPPAPLFLARAMLGWQLGSTGELEPIDDPLRAPALARGRALVAFTAIYAPAGLRQGVEHVWRRDGAIVNVVRLAPVFGGRREGFRTWSRKTSFPKDPVGRWTVDVVTDSGQLIGRLSFRVVA
jgi:hypothetical protein